MSPFTQRCLAIVVSVCPSVRLSHACIASKRIKLRSRTLHRRIVPPRPRFRRGKVGITSRIIPSDGIKAGWAEKTFQALNLNSTRHQMSLVNNMIFGRSDIDSFREGLKPPMLVAAACNALSQLSEDQFSIGLVTIS